MEPVREPAPKAIETPHERVLTHISHGLNAAATDLHRLELARLNRRLAAAQEFQEMLARLKDRVAQRVAVRRESGSPESAAA